MSFDNGLYRFRQQMATRKRMNETRGKPSSEVTRRANAHNGQAPRVFVKNFQQHRSAITGELIKNESQYRDHLKRHNVQPAGGCDAPTGRAFEPHTNERVVASAWEALHSVEGSGQARIERAAEAMRERGLMR